jgi:ubiquinone/menaquinone biosynthesis C-methylase UbiE
MQQHQQAIEKVQKVFNDNWKTYQVVLNNNYLCHREMYAAFHQFLISHYESRAFSILDLGCGDAFYMAQALADIAVKKYTGIDVASVALQNAKQNLLSISGTKQFIYP